MKKFLISFCLFCFCATAACGANLTQTNRGVSFILSMCSSKAQKQGKFFQAIYKNAEVLNAGWLYGATSNPDKCTWAPKFYKDKRPKRVRIHVCNSTCFPERQRKCGPKECFVGYKYAKDASAALLKKDKAMFKRIDRIIEMIKSDYKQAPKDVNGKSTIIDFAVSSCMECTLTRDARKYLNEYVKQKLDPINKERIKEGSNQIVWVDNPLESKDSCMSGYYCEKHGHPTVGNKGIADNDGEDYDTIAQYNYWNKNKEAFMVLAWKPCLNGAASVAGTSGAGGWIYPQDRTAYCKTDREGPEFETFTNKKLKLPMEYKKDEYNKKDLNNCSKYYDINFVWKLGDGRNYTVWLAPYTFPKFKSVYLSCNGEVVDKSEAKPGKRFGAPYSHDPAGKQRKIYDFNKPMSKYPAKCVLHADKNCWLMSTPFFRPVAK
jgi:hypothetical protein